MRLLPALSLVVFTTFFVEFVVGRSILTWLDPGTFIFLFVGYGIVILLLRELALRHGLGLRGLILWGVAYGIINEGLLAKTMIRSAELPVNLYDQYGVAFGISWPWSAAIALWHAFAAVVFPILIIHALFPKDKDAQWLGKRTAYIASGIVLALLCAVFLSDQPVKGTPGQLAIFLALIAALIAAGLRWRGGIAAQPLRARIGPALLGLSVIIPFWALALIAELQLPVILFIAVFAGTALLYAGVVQKKGWDAMPAFLLFGIGWYAHNTLQAAVILLMTAPATAALHIAIAVSLLALLYRRCVAQPQAL